MFVVDGEFFSQYFTHHAEKVRYAQMLAARNGTGAVIKIFIQKAQACGGSILYMDLFPLCLRCAIIGDFLCCECFADKAIDGIGGVGA